MTLKDVELGVGYATQITSSTTHPEFEPAELDDLEYYPGVVLGKSGWAGNSYTAEILGLLAGLVITPPWMGMEQCIDCQGVIDVTTSYNRLPLSKQIRKSYHQLFNVIGALLERRTADTHLTEVKAHDTDMENEGGDGFAKLAAHGGGGGQGRTHY